MRLFLDSSAIIDFLKGDETVRGALVGADLYSNSLCAYEVLTGERHSELKGYKSSYIQASLLFARIETLPVTYADSLKAADIAAKLIKTGSKVDDLDIIMAVHALENDATILTRDNRHFRILENAFGVRIRVLGSAEKK